MGIWSKPLFTVCYGSNGEKLSHDKVTLDFTNDHSQATRLSSHGTLCEGKTTFNESIMTTCDTAKIWGYFDHREICAWNEYFKLLLDQNPIVQEAQAHFFVKMKTIHILLCRKGILN